MTQADQRLGILLPHRTEPGEVAELAREVERLGFHDLWLPENCGFIGGIASASIALAVTERIRVGIGVLPATMRHPFATAMEFGTLAGAFPGRFVGGIGAGVPSWLADLGINPTSPLRAVREVLSTTRRLLAGETLIVSGSYSHVDSRALSPGVQHQAPLYLAAGGPKMLRLAAQEADGVIFSVLSSPQFVRGATRIIDATKQDDSRLSEVVCFTNFAVAEDGHAARNSLAKDTEFLLRAVAPGPLTDALDLSQELTERWERESNGVSVGPLPEEWIARMSVAGTEQECQDRIAAFRQAGVNTLVLSPKPLERTRDLLARAADVGGLRSHEASPV